MISGYLFFEKKCSYYPEVRLGVVDLSDNRVCENRSQPHLTLCTQQYREKVRRVVEKHDCEVKGNEEVTRVACCEIWQARSCMTQSVQRLRQKGYCEVKHSRMYEKLPFQSEFIKEVRKWCPNYMYGSEKCNKSSPSTVIPKSSTAFLTLVCFSLVLAQKCVLLLF